SYDEVVTRFGESKDSLFCEKVADALLRKALALEKLGQTDHAIAAYDSVVCRFGARDFNEPILFRKVRLGEQVVTALLRKAVAFESLGQTDHAIATYGEIVQRFGQATEDDLREYVAVALVRKAQALQRGGRTDEAIAICDESVR